MLSREHQLSYGFDDSVAVAAAFYSGMVSQNTSIVSSSSVSVYQVSLRLVAPKTFQAKLDSMRIFLSKDSCVCKLLYFVTLPAIDVFFFSRESVGVSHCVCVWTALFHTLFLSQVVYFI